MTTLVDVDRFTSFSTMVAEALTPGGHVFFKVAYEPADLEQRVRDLQWNVSVTGTSGPFCWGTGVR